MGSLIEGLFTRHGHAILGCAHTALVFCPAGSPNLAIKVGVDPEDGWPAWAMWCQEHPSPHVPVVHTIEWFSVGGRRHVFVAGVEKLFPTLVGSRWVKACPAGKRDPLALANHVEGQHPGMAKLLREAACAFPHGRWDLGGRNFLERDDGCLVLNDPLSRA